MISLEIEGKPVKLYPGTALQMESDIDTFKWMNLNTSHTYDFSFPRDGNETVLFHAGNDDNETNRFTGAYNCSIKKWGNVIFSGTFELQESIDDEEYRGTFYSIPTRLDTALDQKLSELLTDYNETLYSQTNLNLDVLNDLADKFVRFGRIDLGWFRMYNDDDFIDWVIPEPSPDPEDPAFPYTKYALQFFNLVILLKRTLEAVDYAFIDNATATGDSTNKIYLPGRIYADPLAPSYQLADICPDITLRELIKTFVSLTSAEVFVNPHANELIFTSFDRIIADPRTIDFSKIIYRTDTLRNEQYGLTFKFDISRENEDKYLSNSSKEVITGAVVDTIDDLLDGGPEGIKCFVVRENAWYHRTKAEDSELLVWRYLCEEIFDRTQGKGNIEIICPCTPLHKTIQGYYHLQNFVDYELANIQRADMGSYQVAIDVGAQDNTLFYFDPYDDFPTELIDKINKSLARRICFYFGKQEKVEDELTTWPDRYQMLSDNIGNNGQELAPYALRWNGPDNIVDHGPWAGVADYLATAPRVLRHYAWLNDAQLRQLHGSIRKLKNGKSITLIRKIRYLIDDGDKMLVEIEGYRV